MQPVSKSLWTPLWGAMGDKRALVRFTWCSHNNQSVHQKRNLELVPLASKKQWLLCVQRVGTVSRERWREPDVSWKKCGYCICKRGKRIVLDPNTGFINVRGWAGTRVEILGVRYSGSWICVFWKVGWAGTQSESQEKDVCGRLQIGTQNSARLHTTDTHTKL